MGWEQGDRLAAYLDTHDLGLTEMEQRVALAMAYETHRGIRYARGHALLAVAIGKEPGTDAAKSALTRRIIPALIRKGAIRRVSHSYRGHKREYDVVILRKVPREAGADAA